VKVLVTSVVATTSAVVRYGVFLGGK
jgi:hypothetical protein